MLRNPLWDSELKQKLELNKYSKFKIDISSNILFHISVYVIVLNVKYDNNCEISN